MFELSEKAGKRQEVSYNQLVDVLILGCLCHRGRRKIYI